MATTIDWDVGPGALVSPCASEISGPNEVVDDTDLLLGVDRFLDDILGNSNSIDDAAWPNEKKSYLDGTVCTSHDSLLISSKALETSRNKSSYSPVEEDGRQNEGNSTAHPQHPQQRGHFLPGRHLSSHEIQPALQPEAVASDIGSHLVRSERDCRDMGRAAKDCTPEGDTEPGLDVTPCAVVSFKDATPQVDMVSDGVFKKQNPLAAKKNKKSLEKSCRKTASSAKNVRAAPKPILTWSEKRERNRQHAKQSRERKKDLVQLLQNCAKDLQEENLRLRGEIYHALGTKKASERIAKWQNHSIPSLLQNPTNRILDATTIEYIRSLNTSKSGDESVPSPLALPFLSVNGEGLRVKTGS